MRIETAKKIIFIEINTFLLLYQSTYSSFAYGEALFDMRYSNDPDCNLELVFRTYIENEWKDLLKDTTEAINWDQSTPPVRDNVFSPLHVILIWKIFLCSTCVYL